MPFPNNVDVIVHIGAGRCEELPTYLATSAKRIILVEPSPQLAADLRNRTENDARIQVLEVAVTSNPYHNQLNEYNLQLANSVYLPTELKKLFPGLRLLNRPSVRTVTGHELLHQCELISDKNALVIQAPGAELDIVESLTETGDIDQFSHLAITCPELPLYDRASDSASVLKVLQEQGFDLIHGDDEDPDWPVWTLHRNALKQKLAALTVKLRRTEKELAVEKRRNPDAKDLEQQLAELTVKHQVTSEKLQAAQAELAAEKTKNVELKKKLEQQQSLNGEEALEQRMEYLFEQQRLQLEQATNALGRHVTSTVSNTVKELQADLALQHQFGSELPSLEERDSKLSATVALQLSRQLKSKPYDVILEFGSGLSTTFMARTLRNQSSNKENAEGTELASYVDPSEDDLPKRIICFEHNRAKYNKLTGTLKESGLAPAIKLQYAPLVIYQHEGQDYLYYDCVNSLQQLARLFEEREARIFVLLNQPENDNQPDQLVALPQLLQYLSAHSIDVVVPFEADSKQIRHWCQLLTERGLEYSQPSMFGHGSMQLLSINP